MKWVRRYAHILSVYILIVALFLCGTFLGNETVAVIAEKTPLKRQHHIIIDAGHGGEDGGAVSLSGKRESMLNLQIAVRLNDLFHLLGYDTIMIRTTDTAVYEKGETIAQKKVSDLKHRVQIVNRTENAILISIHQNTFPESRYSGAQVFYAKTTGSKDLAHTLQEKLIQTLNNNSKREEKEGSGIFLLEKITTPGILVECGFLSNPEEETCLQLPEYQKKICCVISTVTAQHQAST